ncbi:MAG: hydrogenase maturation nickel metallochaperone HypA [bacterium]
MHELSIAQSILGIVDDEREKHGAKKILSIHLSVGRMTMVVPEALRWAFGFASEGTPAEGAKLIIDEIPIRGKCGECGSEFNLEEFNLICPHCGSVEIDIVAGRELQVESIEIE